MVTRGRGCWVALVVAVVGALAGCGDDDDDAVDARVVDAAGPDAAMAPVAIFAPKMLVGAGQGWGTMPFPSDLFLDAAGKLTLDDLPLGTDAVNLAYVELFKSSLRTLDGAGIWSNLYFPVSGSIDPASLAGHAVLLDLDDPAKRQLATDLAYRADLGMIILSPKPGVVLRESRRYGAYLTSGVTGPGGIALEPSPMMKLALDATTATSDPILGSARDSLRPLIQSVDAALLPDIVAATVFRTRHFSTDVKKMRDVVSLTPPTIAVTRVLSSAGELDAAFGAQDPTAAPGLIDGQTRGQPHGNIAALIHGTIQLANFVNLTPTRQGFIGYDANGEPLVKSTQTAAFTLILPKRSSFANQPVMLMQHGVNWSRVNVMFLANSAAAKGIATIAIDLIYHGSRANMPADIVNDVTGAAGADGFGDGSQGLFASVNFFHLTSAEVPRAHPIAMRDNLLQATIDLCSLVSFVKGGDLAPLRTALVAAGLAGDLSFKRGVALLATSFGAMVSTGCLAVEPEIGAAVLNVPAAGIPFPALLHSPGYSDNFRAVVLNPLGITSRVVIGHGPSGPRWDPGVMLWNSLLEPGEPTPWAPGLIAGEHRGGVGPHVLVLDAWSDESVSNDSSEPFAMALGLPEMPLALPTQPPMARTRYASFATVSAPQSGNLAGGKTGVLAVMHPASHGMLDTLQSTSLFVPGFPPFMARAAVPINNPIREHHAMWTTFFDDYFKGVPVRAIDPFAP